MKQYSVKLRVKDGFSDFESCEDTQRITCKNLIREENSQNTVYADNRKITFKNCEIVNISVEPIILH